MELLTIINESLVGAPAFLAYLGTAVALLVVFGYLYISATPHKEFKLILENQTSAAVAFGGALLGFVLPLASAISHSVDLLDCMLWGAIALIVQLSVFFVLRLFIRDLSDRIARGEMASAVFATFVAVAVGMLNAACMSY